MRYSRRCFHIISLLGPSGVPYWTDELACQRSLLESRNGWPIEPHGRERIGNRDKDSPSIARSSSNRQGSRDACNEMRANCGVKMKSAMKNSVTLRGLAVSAIRSRLSGNGHKRLRRMAGRSCLFSDARGIGATPGRLRLRQFDRNRLCIKHSISAKNVGDPV